MAFTTTPNGRTVLGNLQCVSGSFTSAPGDNTLLVTHNLYNFVDERAALNAVGAQVPKISNSGGVATIVWDDTQGNSGYYFFVGH